MTGHFGGWISAYVDGQLPAARAERLQAHLLVCAECARELADERRARSLLLAARDVAPGPDLTARILAGAGAGAGTGGAAGTPSASAPRPTPSRTGDHPDLRPDAGGPAYPALTGDLRGRRRAWRWALVGAAAVAVGVVGLAELGRLPLVHPDARRTVALDTLALAPTVGIVGASSGSAAGTPLTAVLADVADDGWCLPSVLPDGVTVASHTRRAGTLEIDFDTPAGPVVMLQRRGTLPTDLGGYEAVAVGEKTVYVLTGEPWHVVTEVGGVVVELFAPDGSGPGLEVLAALPAAGDGGLAGRVARGWTVLTAGEGR